MSPVRTRFLDLDLSPAEALARIAALPAPVLLDSTLAGADAWSVLAAMPVRTWIDQLPPWSPAPTRTRASTPNPNPDPDRDPDPDPEPGPAWDPAPTQPDVSPATSAEGDSVPPPFRTGFLGYLEYDSAPLWNPLLRIPSRGHRAGRRGPDGSPPDGGIGDRVDFRAPGEVRSWWGRYEASLAYRHRDGTWWISWSETPSGRRAASELEAALRGVRNAASPGASTRPPLEIGAARSEVRPEDHARDVRTVRDWIAQGHVYQANLTYRMSAPFRGRGLDLYPHLRRSSPVPFGSYLRPDQPGGGDLEILAASPELFLEIEGDRIRTQPIKGTRPRDREDPARDRALAHELFRSEKDRAELTMIVDLERNDLGRICRYGTVRTGAFPRVGSFRGVHHLLADVEGRLRAGVDLAGILGATFPGGSVTGAPKIRAMEILADLERSPREIYTGALGYLGDDGRAVLSLTIRTLWTRAGELRLGVGGGIVTDSDPEAEWAETEDKARTLLEAIRTAGAEPFLPEAPEGDRIDPVRARS